MDCVHRGSEGFAMLMRPNKAEAAVRGCHCLGDVVVRMRKMIAPSKNAC